MPEVGSRGWWEARIASGLTEISKVRLHQLLEALGDPPKASNVPPDFWQDYEEEMRELLGPLMERIYIKGAKELMREFPVGGVDWELTNRRAAEWAQDYSFELVTTINDTNRRYLQDAIHDFYATQMTHGELWDEIAAYDDFTERAGRLFGIQRARVIAITEVTRAHTQGERQIQHELWQQGIQMIAKWQTRRDEKVCPICGPLDNQLERDNGGWGNVVEPPAHPRCRCWLVYEHVDIAESEEAVRVPPVAAPPKLSKDPKPKEPTAVEEPVKPSVRERLDEALEEVERRKQEPRPKEWQQAEERKTELRKKKQELVDLDKAKAKEYMEFDHELAKLRISGVAEDSIEYQQMLQKQEQARLAWQSARAQRSAVQDNIWQLERAQREIIRQRNIRILEPLYNGTGEQILSIDYGSQFASSDPRAAAITEGLDLVHRIYAPEALPAGGAITVKKGGKGRSFHMPSTHEVHLTTSADTGTAVHEFGHWIELESDVIHGNLVRVIEDRFKDEKKWDNAYAADFDLRGDGTSWEDLHYNDQYASKVYRTSGHTTAVTGQVTEAGGIRATELLTMYTQHLAEGNLAVLGWADDILAAVYASTQGETW